MTSSLDCQIFSWKVFLVKYLCRNFFLQIDSKWSKMWKKWLSVWPTGWTAQRTKFDWQPFFRLFITPNDPKCEKKTSCQFCQPVGRPDRPPDWIFTSDCFFTFWIIWSWFGNKIFNQNFDQKKPLNCYLTIDDIIMCS